MIGLLAALAAVTAGCAPPPGWEAVARRGTPFVIFGEMHGTEQAPALVGEVVCALAVRHERVLVALEQNATDDAALAAAMSLNDDRDFAVAIPTALHWRDREDGMASRSMLALLTRLHRLRQAGRQVDLVAFGGDRDDDQAKRWRALPGQGPVEAAQAENIRMAANAQRYDHIIVLVGDLHARKQPVERMGVSWEPMAMRLAPAGAITTLDMAFAAGSAWNCIGRPGFQLTPGQAAPPGAIECGAHPTSGSPDPHRSPFIGIGSPLGVEHADPAYDGVFWVGPVTAAVPVQPVPPPRP